MERDHRIISEVIFKEGNVPPIIAYFENGDLKSEAGGVRECGFFRKNNEPSKYIVAVNTKDNSLYMGSEPPEENYRTLLAVQGRGSNKVQLIEVDKVSLKAKPIVSSTPAIISEESSHASLNKKFGSKQKKLKTEQRERLAVNIETVSQRLHKTASNIIVGDSLVALDNSEYYGTFVPCNRDATNVKDVYNLRDIISENELQELEAETQQILSNTEEINSLNYSSFLNENLKEVNAEDKLLCTQILLYAECLVQALMLKEKDIQKKNVVVCPFSECINTKILKDFTELVGKKGMSSRRVPRSFKNKMLAYAIVAGLLACKFKLHIESLSKLTKISHEKLLKLSRTLGAVPFEKGNKNTVVLKIPLPSVQKPHRKKRKS